MNTDPFDFTFAHVHFRDADTLIKRAYIKNCDAVNKIKMLSHSLKTTSRGSDTSK